MTGSLDKIQGVFEEQTVSYVEVAPVSGTKYEWRTGSTGSGAALGTQYNVRIIGIAIRVSWTVQPDPLQVHLTIDGKASEAINFTNPVNNTYYSPLLYFPAVADLLTVTSGGAKPFYREGREVKIEFETTGGTVSEMRAWVKWAKM